MTAMLLFLQVQPTIRVDAVVLQANWHMNQNFKALLLLIAILCSIGLLLHLGSSLWTRVHRYSILHTNTQSLPAQHADLPFVPVCGENACQEYMGALNSVLNRSQDPCEDFYRFVCDGWMHQHHSLAVVDAAEELMYRSALNTIYWTRVDIGRRGLTTSAASSVGQKVAGFARSCMYLRKSSMEHLKNFLAERHLPWPNASVRDLLEILLDLSGNWNLHLWFQVTFEMTPFRGGAVEPVLRISHSAAFGAWIAFMRPFAGQPAASKSALRYRRYVKDMLEFFGVSESNTDELAAKIEEMDRLTLGALAPPMAELYPKTLRIPIHNLTNTVTPGIITGHLLLLLNEYFIWARRFSAGDIAEVSNPGLLRSVVYLRGLKSETREALTLSLGLRVVHALGWMAHRRIADITLDIMGLPPSAHYRRCLTLIDGTVGVAWHSLFPEQPGAEALVQDVQDILRNSVERHGKPPLMLRARPAPAQWDNESSLAKALPEPTPGDRFFVDWMNLMNSPGRLEEQHVLNVLKPGSVLSHGWNFHGVVTVAEGFFVFPLFHPDLPTAVNYGGAGRLIADEVLRGLLHSDPGKPQRSQSGRDGYSHQANGSSATEVSQDVQPYNVDKKALLAALAAYRLGTERNHGGSAGSSLAKDRLFFVASCYALCSSTRSVDALYGDAKNRCNEPVKGLPEFSAAFNCGTPRTRG
ncbi:hypothetical protein HPB48_010095 [Haemaphysalis longicornis]|uniref:Peptidase M13 N-terminal domain-containing protein n=1 Tax=Haemaphysalis longicornis TaxID=44386 RepID=A0A9J6FP52_HAELO|nr:hypothetical protein HPB48_010095 [Haemaphysalis longicornis]